jgi:hypothetical protein
MELTGYGRLSEASCTAGGGPGNRERAVGAPTNAELTRLLEAVHARVAGLRDGQEGPARAVAAPARRSE